MKDHRVISISNGMPTPEEVKALELRERKVHEAGIARDKSRRRVIEAKLDDHYKKQAYERALNDLVEFRKLIDPANRS